MAQACSGVAKKIAETTGTHGGSLFTVLDVLGGVVAAQGITIALLNRCVKKVGARVTSSLMSAAALLCADDFQQLYDPPGAGPISKSIINEVYETGQGKIAIECCDITMLMRLAEALELATNGETENFEQNLDKLFLTRTAEEWAEVLERARIPSAIVIEDLTGLQAIPYLRPSLNPGSYTMVNSPWSFR
jgi:crotonobetainyl-CoA:carnitine CoA-transferase CaiB-like acyl-CoA transferase